MMKKKLAALLVASLTVFSLAAATVLSDEHVGGYYRGDGSYVNDYYRTDPNNTRDDNYSHEGNVKPYTGQRGFHR